MEKEFAALEFRSKNLVLVIGNVLDGKVNITNKIIRPLSVALKDGEVLDSQSLVNDIKGILSIEDPTHNLKININEISFVLPPNGLEVYNAEKVTTVISRTSRIEKIDIENAISMLKKERIPNQDNSIVDIIPNCFAIDGNQEFTVPPIGQSSTQLAVNANIYSLPTRLVQDLMDCVKEAGINIKRNVIAPLGVCELFASYKSSFKTYVLVDCGRRNTTLSFIGDEKLYASKFNRYGQENLVDNICAQFNLLRTDGEELANLYGYDPRESQLNPPIAHTVINGTKKNFYLSDLNVITSEFFQNWISNFVPTLQELLDDVGGIEDVELIFTGEATKIKGFQDYVKNYLIKYKCTFVTLPCVGGEDTIYLNCIGAILSSAVYKGSLSDEFKGKIRDVTREERREYKETSDEL